MKKIQTLERVWTETQRTTYVVPQKKPIFVLQKVFKSAKSSSMVQWVVASELASLHKLSGF